MWFPPELILKFNIFEISKKSMVISAKFSTLPCLKSSKSVIHNKLSKVSKLFSCSFSPTTMSSDSNRIKIAVVGDVHGHWDPRKDKLALDYLKPNLVLFVGDFGEENILLTKQINGLDYPKLIILGNHDAWYASYQPRDEILSSGAKEQLDLLGETHIGYGMKEYADMKVCICGGRPFSWGGDEWIHCSHLFSELYDVKNDIESATKIFKNCKNVQPDHALILIAHNGPKGLGESPESICGKDFRNNIEPIGGDYGDSDLQLAIQMMRQNDRNPSLVIFGHMHHITKGGKKRIMLQSDDYGSVFVNAAVVPRISPSRYNDASPTANQSKVPRSSKKQTNDDVEKLYFNATDHHFVWIELEGKNVAEVSDVWIMVSKEHVHDDDDGYVVKEVSRSVRLINKK